ncbi:hypothetical protein TSUD_147850 [Trifolium subterraneum]|uniref:Cytochrome b5 heme-binding domain-containing protein n=1 Tax=Trifolium subterraneum TaxID=3900 RepID=A0A2Z6NAP6_TRISU|nr:hypothetical protein TSUD_147850 [Trifolium subterraneum]
MWLKTLATSPLSRIALLVLFIAFLLNFYINDTSQRLFSTEELALFNGTDQGLPILLGILGSVFDVTKGKSHYGSGGGYNHFAGKYVLKSFLPPSIGVFLFCFDSLWLIQSRDGLTDSLRGLSSTEVKSVVDWRDFYLRSYKYVGKLVGRYYDSQGNPTKYLKGVWCDVGYPRLVQRPLEIALTGKMSKRCACFEKSQLDQPGLEVYEGCDYHANRCKA